MSCQQVPRLPEDPYTFTDTAPATASLFNSQIHKLTSTIPSVSIPIHQSDIKTKFQSQKAQQILSPNQRILTNQSQQQQQQQFFNKQQNPQQQLLSGQVLNESANNFFNRIYQKNDVTKSSGVLSSQVNQRCYQFYDQPTKKLTKNNLNVTTQSQLQQIIPQISTTPTRKFLSIPFPPLQTHQQQQQHLQNIQRHIRQYPQQQQQQPQQPQIPQIVPLNQAHPLYSVAKQSPILTTTSNQSTSLSPLYQRSINSMVSSNSQKYQLTSVLASNSPANSFIVQPPQQNHNNHSNFTNNLNNVKFEQIQTNSLLSFPTLTNVNNQLVNQISPQNNLTTNTTVIATNQPLPVSNFAQPQQIKQLSSTVPSAAFIAAANAAAAVAASATNHINSTPSVPTTTTSVPVVVNNKNSICKTASPKTTCLKEPKPKKSKISDSLVVTTTTNEKLTKNNNKTVFVTPKTAKLRDSRVLSTESVGSISKINNKSQVPSAAPARRAYSQSSHHEALERISRTVKKKPEWQAPESYAFDILGPFTNVDAIGNKNINISSSNYSYSEHSIKCDNDLRPCCVQKHWLQVEDIRNSIPSWSQGREKRIELRKAQLRRQAIQHIHARKFMSPLTARKRMVYMSQLLKNLKEATDNNSSSSVKKCSLPNCQNNAVALTMYCNLHITRNSDQHLFLPCTAKFSDNTQCRIPVFDISHELPLCREHAWKRDNCQRMEHKPKKGGGSTTTVGVTAKNKKTKATTKRSKRKRRPLLASDSGLGGMENMNEDDSIGSVGLVTTTIAASNTIENSISSIVNKAPVLPLPELIHPSINNYQQNHNNNDLQIPLNSFQNLMSTVSQINFPPMNLVTSTTTPTSAAPSILRMGNNFTGGGVTELTTQEMLSICENSSAYASSEDTGVGGLSETELINGAHDVIGNEEIPLVDTRLLEEHDLTNVLNQLPVDAFNELFTSEEQNGANEPTQEEQEYLERALELVNKQVKSLQQMTSGDQLETNFLESFLDTDECQILDDSDICADDVLHSPDTSGIDTSTLLVDGTSNSGGSCSNPATLLNIIGPDLRNLVHTK